MDVDLKGGLKYINLLDGVIQHRGIYLTKKQIKIIFEYGISKGFKTMKEIPDSDVDDILNKV